MDTCEWIGLVSSAFSDSHKEKVVVVDDEMKKKFRVIELAENGWLVVKQGDLKIEFAVLENSGSCEGRVEAVVLFHGMGVGGNLRELRHSYWGDEGYISDLDSCMRLIAKSFVALEEFFDVYG